MSGISYATKHTATNIGGDGNTPEPGELALKLRWVRGIESNLNDLVVRGERFSTHFGDALLTGTLRRKIVGASEIKITISDPFRRVLNKPIVAEQHELELDGLHWLLVKISGEGMGQPMTLTYEPRVVAELKKVMGPLRGRREVMTRAEFAKHLSELIPKNRRPRFISPLLHKAQPIKTEAEVKKAQSTATSERKKGLNRAGLTCKGQTPTEEQYKLGEMALAIAESHAAPSAVMTMVIMALIDETDMGAVQRGNVLAALEPYTQVRNAAEEIAAFVSGEPTWTGTSAIEEYEKDPGEKLSVLVQRVQRSATEDGSNYAEFEAESKEWTEAWGGGVDVSSTSEQITKKYEFAVKKEENAWHAMVRLAGEVNWRCFESAGWIYFIDEIELLKQKTLMRLTPFAPGLLNLKYDHDEGKPTDELTVTAWAKAWEAPPGTMVEVVGWGPNDGTYLVSTIEAPLATRESEVQITLKRPHKPLKEPAAETTTRQIGGAGKGDGNGEDGMGIYAGTAEDVVNEVVFYAQKNGFPDISPTSVREANAVHGPTVDGGRSDHQGPPATAWAADISNGYETPEEAALAAAIAKAFNIPWDGAGLVTHEESGYRLQLIHNTMEGGNHYNHVHFGCEVL